MKILINRLRQEGRFRWHYVVLTVTVLIVISPLVPLLYQAFLDGPLYDRGSNPTLDNFVRLFSHAGFRTSFSNSVIFAAIATVFAQVVGTVSAVLVARTNLPLNRIFSGLFVAPIFVSHLVLAVGYYTLYGPSGYVTMWATSLVGFQPWNLYTIGGMAVLAGASQAPLAFLFCLASTRAIDSTLENAALTAGASSARVLWTITIPLMRPAIIFGLSINFVNCMEMLSIPLIFGQSAGIPLFSVFIYKSIMQAAVPDYGVVSVSAIIMLALVMGLLGLQRLANRNSKRFVAVTGKTSRSEPFALKRWKWPAFVLMAAYAVLFIVAPILGLVLRSFTEIFTPLLPITDVLTLGNYQQALQTPLVQRSLVNTVLVATVTGVVGTALVFFICLVSYRSKFWAAGLLSGIAQVPRAIPGVFAGVAFLYLVLTVPALGWLRNLPIILILAYLSRFIAVGVGAVQPALQQISTDLDSSAQVSGAGWWRASITILLPILKPAMFACFILIFIQALKEYVTAVFLVAPGSEVVGSTLLSFWNEGQVGIVAALASILMVITFAILFVARKLFGVKLYG